MSGNGIPITDTSEYPGTFLFLFVPFLFLLVSTFLVFGSMW